MFSQNRLVWGVWGVLLLVLTLLFGTYLYTLRHQVREATWAEGKAASHLVQWRLQAQMQHTDDLILHICESYERLGPNLTEKDAVFKGRLGTAKPYEQVLIMGPKGESMMSLPTNMPAWGDVAWLDLARQHTMGQIFTMVVSKNGQDLLARVLPVWSETGEFKGAVVGVLPPKELETLLRETSKAYGLNLSMLHRDQLVAQSSHPLAATEDAQVWREQIRMPELDLVLDVTLRQDAVTARLAMAWQWLMLIWCLIGLGLTGGAVWLDRFLTRQALTSAKLKEEQEAARVRAAFLANMSHELRTPMMGVLGAAELLENSTEAERSRYLKMIQDSGRHLLGLLNNVLDYSRLNANAMPLDLQEVAPLSLFEEVVQSFVPQAELNQLAFNAQLSFPTDMRLRLDSFRLTQIMSNLLGNAFKFTHQGSVRVQAGLSNEAGQAHLWVKITDTGIGLTTAQKQRLFQPFSQADESTSRSYGGTGLGLVIVKQLLNLMNGMVQIESRPGSGTEIGFSVPVEVLKPGTQADSSPGEWQVDSDDPLLRSAELAHLRQLGVKDSAQGLSNGKAPLGQITTLHASPTKITSQPQSVTAPNAEAANRPRILVAEDNAVTRQILSSYFSNTAYQIDFANDGEDALAFWHQQTYDLAILDCHMPKLDGFSVAQRIRSTESPPQRTPLVALTAAILQEDVARCKHSGMDDVWFKPISKTQLLQKVQQMLQDRLQTSSV